MNIRESVEALLIGNCDSFTIDNVRLYEENDSTIVNVYPIQMNKYDKTSILEDLKSLFDSAGYRTKINNKHAYFLSVTF